MEEKKGTFCKIIFWIIAFIIIAGLFIQCAQTSGRVIDAVFDHPEVS